MRKFQITFRGQVYELDVEEISSAASDVKKNAAAKAVPIVNPVSGQAVIAPMPGKIVKINVQIGDVIKRGDVICILEAMKMENEIMATQDGKVSDISVSLRQVVSTGDVLIVID